MSDRGGWRERERVRFLLLSSLPLATGKTRTSGGSWISQTGEAGVAGSQAGSGQGWKPGAGS